MQTTTIAMYTVFMEKEKILYISDLDGTLLNEKAEVSAYSANIINRLIAKGMHFSLATARTAMSAHILLKEVDFALPVGLMNGTVMYDLAQSKYVDVQAIAQPDIEALIKISRAHNNVGFLYCLLEGEMTTYYENLATPAIRRFYDDRILTQNRQFTQIADFVDAKGEIVYYVLIDTKEALLPIYEASKSITGIDCVYYIDTYNDGTYYLEFFNKNASKQNTVEYLKHTYGFTKVIGFGDNLNDLPLFAACDETYAVRNALPEVKAAADGIIDSNAADGVAKFLLEHFKG